jgi:hypothetical protein
MGPKKDKEQVFGDTVSDYLNQADVRVALHIPDHVQPWNECVPEA